MKKRTKSLVEITEQAIREAVSDVPEIQALPELAYVETVLEALDAFKCGLEMRLEELQDGDDE